MNPIFTQMYDTIRPFYTYMESGTLLEAQESDTS